jgi:hypothetical protein
MDYSNKRPIDSANLKPTQLKTLRKFLNVRSDDEVIDFAKANGVKVGRWESQQKNKAYSFLTEIYNDFKCDIHFPNIPIINYKSELFLDEHFLFNCIYSFS